ncbi:MAG: DUF3142 domain-containing protein [Myxococcales bacterium]|nr:DUF3142 domain-containing protein [Myxococcales bacterium]
MRWPNAVGGRRFLAALFVARRPVARLAALALTLSGACSPSVTAQPAPAVPSLVDSRSLPSARSVLGAVRPSRATRGSRPVPEEPSASGPTADEPRVILWVWHGEQDLRGLPSDVGVAYLARTVTARLGAPTITMPRRSALWLDPDTARTAVVHVEVRRGATLAAAADHVLRAAESASREEGVREVQIDFDCPRSMRADYAVLLAGLRARLPRAQRLSITALGSWCASDRWLADVDVDRVVPMLFGPGHEAGLLHRARASGEPLREPRCRDAIGVREGDPPLTPTPRTLFVFPRSRWTRDRAVHEARRAGRGTRPATRG